MPKSQAKTRKVALIHSDSFYTDLDDYEEVIKSIDGWYEISEEDYKILQKYSGYHVLEHVHYEERDFLSHLESCRERHRKAEAAKAKRAQTRRENAAKKKKLNERERRKEADDD